MTILYRRVITPEACSETSFHDRLESSLKTGSPTHILSQQTHTTLEKNKVLRRIADGVVLANIFAA